MTRVFSHLRELGNSPTWERDASAITSPLRMGSWFLILNLLIIGAMAGLYKVFASVPPGALASQALADLGLGWLFACAIFLALTLFLTFFIPIRVVGAFFTPRLGRYFDQIVISGVSPARYVAGKVIAQNVFLLFVLAVSLPYFLLCLSFGGVSFGYVAICFIALWLYVNLLVVAMLAASMILSETWALVIVIGGFFLSALIGFFPASPHPFNLTPIAVISSVGYQDHIQPNLNMGKLLKNLYEGSFSGLTLFQSHWMLYFLEASILILLGLLAVALGPINCLARGVNTFGEAVLPGDKQRSTWAKRRLGLRRLGELSFLYENASRAWKDRDFRRRWMLRELVFVLTIGVGLIWLYWPSMSVRFYRFHFQLALLGCLLNGFLFIDTWVSSRLRQGKWEAAPLNALFYGFNLLLIFAAFGWWPWHQMLDADPLHWQDSNIPYGYLGAWQQNLRAIGLLIVMAATFYATLFWYSTRVANKFFCWLAGIAIYGVIALLPNWIWNFVDSISAENDILPTAPVLELCSPFKALESLRNDGRFIEVETARLGLWACVAWHVIAATLFVWLGWRKHRTLPVRSL